MDINHANYLQRFNVELSPERRTAHDFEVLVHSPLSAHPTGRGAAIVGENNQLSLLIKNQTFEGDELQPYQARIRRYVRSASNFSTARRGVFEEPASIRLTSSGWGLNTLHREDLGRHSMIEVDASMNWSRQHLKPRGGLDVHTFTAKQPPRHL